MGADAYRRESAVIIVTLDSDSHILFVCSLSYPSPGIASQDFEDVSDLQNLSDFDQEKAKLSTVLGFLNQLCSGNSKSSPARSLALFV